MSRRSSSMHATRPEPSDAWLALLDVLRGKQRPPLDARSLKVVNLITASACDVRLRSDSFDVWYVARALHHWHAPELAAPVVCQLMRRLAVARVHEPVVGTIERVGLGSRFHGQGARTVWIVPGESETQLLVREPPALPGPNVAMPVPDSGAWALPTPCARREPLWLRLDCACPHCGARPETFRALEATSALVCPACARSFLRRA